MHTRAEILQASAAWVWFPRGSEQDDTELQLVRYPERFGGGVRASAVRSTADAAAVLDRAIDRTREWGESRLTFWTNAADQPDLEAEFRRRRADHVDTVEVFARDVAEPVVAVPEGVDAEVVRTMEQVRDMDAVNVPVWEQQPLDEEDMRAEFDEVVSALEAGTHVRVLARLHGRAVSTGGCTIVDGFARLWGAATLPDARGRGAYRAVLAERLRVAATLGATTALVKGRTATSAPILARAGFLRFGEERAYRLHV